MNKKFMRIILCFMLVWFIMFATDVTRTFALLKPIFALQYPGGEMIEYLGLGYSIEFYYPLMGPGQAGSGVSFRINPVLYIALNLLLIASLVFFKYRRKHLK